MEADLRRSIPRDHLQFMGIVNNDVQDGEEAVAEVDAELLTPKS